MSFNRIFLPQIFLLDFESNRSNSFFNSILQFEIVCNVVGTSVGFAHFVFSNWRNLLVALVWDLSVEGSSPILCVLRASVVQSAFARVICCQMLETP